MRPYILFIFAIAFLFFQSCAPVYVPNTVNAPLFDEPGEIQIAGYTGTNGIDVQAAASVAEHFAIMGNGSFGARDGDDTDEYHKHNYGEFGLGFYNSFGELGRYEFYGGYGRGNSEAYDTYDFFGTSEILAKGKYDRYFLQGNIGLKTGVFEGALTYRMSRINFYQFEEVRTSATYAQDEVELFIEPALTLKVGSENFKFVTQFGLSYPYDDHAEFGYDPLYVTFGLLGKIPAW